LAECSSAHDVQYIYEDDDDGSQYIDQSDYIEDGTEIVEYHEVIEEEDIENEAIYGVEQIVKQEADAYEHSDFDSSYQMETSSQSREE
jgi:hypothetical protein